MRARAWLAVVAALIATFPSGALPKRRAVSSVIRVCLPMSSDNLFLSYLGEVSGGNPASGLPVAIGEQVDFSVLPRGYSFFCDAHTVTWNFSDGSQPVTTFPQSPVHHTFTSTGMFVVTAVVRNSSQQYVLGTIVFVAAPS